jgi:hypothetical protein
MCTNFGWQDTAKPGEHEPALVEQGLENSMQAFPEFVPSSCAAKRRDQH